MPTLANKSSDLARPLSLARQQRAVPTIDVRSPCEFARGSIPHSVNIPVLNDAERRVVGTVYRHRGTTSAVAEGVEIFAQKSHDFLESLDRVLGDHHHMNVCCWRGGMRSGSIGRWLSAMGYRCSVVDGGYKEYRRRVLERLEQLASHRFLVLDGRTGSGKTALLRRLADELPVVDFEKAACHRGSAFGDFAQTSPPRTQQNFENVLVQQYEAVVEAPRLLVEIENRLGPVAIDPQLRRAVYASPMVRVTRDFDDRVERLAKEYAAGWSDECDDLVFAERLQMLRRHISASTLADILAAVKRRDFRSAVATLLRTRYDAVYDRGMGKRQKQVVACFNLSHQEPEAVDFIRHQLDPAQLV